MLPSSTTPCPSLRVWLQSWDWRAGRGRSAGPLNLAGSQMTSSPGQRNCNLRAEDTQLIGASQPHPLPVSAPGNSNIRNSLIQTKTAQRRLEMFRTLRAEERTAAHRWPCPGFPDALLGPSTAGASRAQGGRGSRAVATPQGQGPRTRRAS